MQVGNYSMRALLWLKKVWSYLSLIKLLWWLGSVPVYRYMHNFLGQMEFERVPCLTLHGNVPHNHIVHHLTMFQNMWQRESHCSQLPGIEKCKWQNWSNLS
uniref:Uncharacterized protein n=1 Tax=Populus trichocarpa TaxID=3694 RepID=A0A3N7HQL8_POPTR